MRRRVIATGLVVALAAMGPRVASGQTGAAGDRECAIVVTDAKTHAPIDDAAVEIGSMSSMGFGEFSVVATTDANGHARFKTPADLNRKDLRVEKQNYVPVGLFLGSEGVKGRREFTVDLARGTRIGGRVTDGKGRPVGGAVVEIDLMQNTEEGSWVPLQGGARVRTAEDGTWRFDGTPADASSFALRVTDARYAPMWITSPSPADLRRGRLKAVLLPGLELSGVVVDGSGKPVPGAAVSLGYTPDAQQATTSDAQGRFRLDHVAESRTQLLVQKAGFAPASQEVIPSAQQPPLRITLGPGRTIRARVTDRGGKPVGGATVTVLQWGVPAGWFLWSARTDLSGRFVGRDWPDGPVQCSIDAAGASHKTVELTAGPGEQTIVLDPPLKIFGSVTDARTGMPIDPVMVRYGGDMGNMMGTNWNFDQRHSASGGQFSIMPRTDYPLPAYRIAFQARGYVPLVSNPVQPSQGSVRMDVKLEPYRGPDLIVLDPAGKPAADVTANVSSGDQSGLAIEDGENVSANGVFPPARSGPDGRAYLALPQGPYVIALAGKAGFTTATSKDIARLPRVTLRPWATVTGTNLRDGKPVANQSVTVRSERTISDGTAHVMLQVESRGISDLDGHFAIPHCIPGSAIAGGLENDEKLNSSMQQFDTPVMVAQGGPTDIVIGQSAGTTVIGRVVPPSNAGADWPTRTMATLAPKYRRPALPKDFANMDDAARKQWRESVANSPAMLKQLQDLQVRARDAQLQADGSFRLTNVLPGDYDLSVEMHGPVAASLVPTTQPQMSERVGYFHRDLTVPSGGNTAMIDLGRIELKANRQLKTGDAAPPLEAKTL
ncbi:MAG TPA: carboxypeptidase-like regulatory domain-containing protein, partial [Tepidisphaeraceae bacterium]|nr:carboxypeptidase-like regulatory domain-containing protein [Tepidisphaeraceae bacterium]